MSKQHTEARALREENARLAKEIYDLRVEKRELEKKLEDSMFREVDLREGLAFERKSSRFYRETMLTLTEVILAEAKRGG